MLRDGVLTQGKSSISARAAPPGESTHYAIPGRVEFQRVALQYARHTTFVIEARLGKQF
jgi:hypothetical protein